LFRLNPSITSLYLLLFGVALEAAWTPACADLRILDAGANHLRLEYTADQVDLQRAMGRSFLIGIPEEATVRLEVLEQREVEVREPAPFEGRPESGSIDPVFLGNRGRLRDQYVVELVFSPVATTGNETVFHDRMVVELDFDGPGISRRKRRERYSEAFYRGLVANHDQARDWRIPRRRRVSRALQAESGMRLKIAIEDEGIYLITGRDLEDAGVDLADFDPLTARLLYGGGRALPRPIEHEPNDQLAEQAILVDDGGDGSFDADDQMLFYAEPVARWEYLGNRRAYSYRRNLYTKRNIYWLEFAGDQAGLRYGIRDGSPAASDPQIVSSHRVREHVETEAKILIQTFSVRSGYEWYWEEFQGNARNFSTSVRDAVDDPVDIRIRFYGWTSQDHPFSVRWNDEEIGKISFFGSQVDTSTFRAESGVREGVNQLGLVHESKNLTRLDWYELEYSRLLSAQRSELRFDGVVGSDIPEYQLSGFRDEVPRIFEFSDGLTEIVNFEHDPFAGTVRFQDLPASAPRNYLVAGEERWKKPISVELDRSANLRSAAHGAAYLVIAHNDFLEAAERLVAWRAQDERHGPALASMFVDVADIYDEFSGGLVDPAAIRNFLKFAAENWNPAPLYVVLFGDGSYDYKNNSGTSPGNWIPPYQDGESTYDEWYVRVAGSDRIPDMAIGRLTVQTPAEADLVVDKLIDYDNELEEGSWRSRVLLIADDLHNSDRPGEVESWFLWDAERMASGFLPAQLDLRKLYLAKFPLEGRLKPRARDEFIRRFNEGALIVTYLGHGNWQTLAHEQMFVTSRDLSDVANGGRLPFMFMAASQVGPFDDPVRSSMPEDLLKLPSGGVIGMISATRVGFHHSNMTLAYMFHDRMYRSERESVPVGLGLMEAKQLVQITETDRVNVQRYSLIGDPAMRLASPRYRVLLEAPDTLRALGAVPISGRIVDPQGNFTGDFNGEVLVNAFDSALASQLDGFTYVQLGSPLFRANLPVVNGRFETEFRVPKDITYRGVDGRVSAYASADGRPSAFGSIDGLVLAGTADDVDPDDEGPAIRIEFQGQSGFESGDGIPQEALLQASISDPSGINVTGETGHEIELVIDNQVFQVTESFAVDGGSYGEGSLEFQLPALEPGEHSIRLKAWDSFNNSGSVKVLVDVAEAGTEVLSEVLFVPNPMAQEGHFTYILTSRATLVDIKIFTLSGRLVDEVRGSTELGFNQVSWKPAQKIAGGTLVYHVHARTEEGSSFKRTAALQVINQ
jgi:hypothetical protein